ncbi:bifunctional 2-C-methyl-D-erythritol 4-phosphate cytidylyltransferase/2-C-methyl-D-erythritol 2,4-cyclodiphosphate synthase [Alsobacter sp. R-9]
MDNPLSDVAVILVAAGRGERVGGAVPKQYLRLAGRMILTRSIEAMARAVPGGPLLVVWNPADAALYDAAVTDLPAGVRKRLVQPVAGGATRQASVRAGLEALERLAPVPRIVLIHDAARPFVTPATVSAVMAAAPRGGAIPGIAVTDTIKRVEADGRIAETPERGRLRAVQTPQGFPFTRLVDAHRRAAAAGVTTLTDDAAIMEWVGETVVVVEGDPGNTKITTTADIAEGERRLAGSTGMTETRVGSGFDVHAFTDGTFVTLGGLQIPHDRGVLGHSDADVVLHAITDAVLGALVDGDIGQHFPPSDPQWKGASSDRFLAFAVERMRRRGGRLVLVDVTVVCEAPRIGPHREAMRARIAQICGISPSRVAVKATTSEQMGFTGRREGIVAQATATIELPRVVDEEPQ